MMIIARTLLTLLCFVALGYGQPSPDTATMIAVRDSLKSENLDWSHSNPCLWTGLECETGSHRVTRIQIGNRGISGTLTCHLRNLSSLTVLEVMGNNLTGKIPSLAGLKSLERVFVNDNGFALIDADFFTDLSSLQFVNLDNNPLSPWKLPSSLTDATSLAVFSAANCSLSGMIPDLHWHVTFPNLTALDLSGNSLVGELPTSFAGSSVRILRLNGQKLNGSISVLQDMTALTEVFLQENRFSGTIPACSGLTSLKVFNVSGNQLTGIVPDSFTDLPSLSNVALGNNLLQGPMPFSSATTLDTRGVNSFCLDDPPCDFRVNVLLSVVQAFGFPLIFAERWKGNDQCNGMWVGITCNGADITVINFQGMGLTGYIDSIFVALEALQVINLSHNNLTGEIPEELTGLSNLKTLDVSYNHLYGIVPHFRPNVVDTRGNPRCRPAPPSLGSSSRKKIVVAVIAATVLGLLLIGVAIFLCVKRKKQYHNNMHPQQHSGDQDALKITLGNLRVCGSESGLSVSRPYVVL